MFEESSPTRMKAAKKGSLATEEGGPRDQVGSSDDEGAFEDRCLNNDNFKGGTTHPELWALLRLGPLLIMAHRWTRFTGPACGQLDPNVQGSATRPKAES